MKENRHIHSVNAWRSPVCAWRVLAAAAGIVAVSVRPSVAQQFADTVTGIVTREFIYVSAPFPSAHASTIVEARPGLLLAAWFGGAHEGSDDVEIWYSRKESGQQWSQPVALTDTPDMPTWNPVLFQAGDQTWLFYKVGPSPREWVGAYRLSQDGGQSWSPVVYLPAGLTGPVRAKPIILADGTWLAGTSVEAGYRGDTPADAPYRAWSVWVELSTDQGQHWTRNGPVVAPAQAFGVIQPTMWQSPTGDVHMLMRSTERIGRIVSARSRDGGRTWIDVRPTDLPNPNAGIDVLRLRDGRLVLVYNHLPRGRSAIHVAQSSDEGVTWSAPKVLEQGQQELSYPAVIQSSDGLVHVTYTWQRTHVRHVVIDPRELPVTK